MSFANEIFFSYMLVTIPCQWVNGLKNSFNTHSLTNVRPLEQITYYATNTEIELTHHTVFGTIAYTTLPTNRFERIDSAQSVKFSVDQYTHSYGRRWDDDVESERDDVKRWNEVKKWREIKAKEDAKRKELSKVHAETSDKRKTLNIIMDDIEKRKWEEIKKLRELKSKEEAKRKEELKQKEETNTKEELIERDGGTTVANTDSDDEPEQGTPAPDYDDNVYTKKKKKTTPKEKKTKGVRQRYLTGCYDVIKPCVRVCEDIFRTFCNQFKCDDDLKNENRWECYSRCYLGFRNANYTYKPRDPLRFEDHADDYYDYAGPLYDNVDWRAFTPSSTLRTSKEVESFDLW